MIEYLFVGDEIFWDSGDYFITVMEIDVVEKQLMVKRRYTSWNATKGSWVSYDYCFEKKKLREATFEP